jgi:hypothetical protein
VCFLASFFIFVEYASDVGTKIDVVALSSRQVVATSTYAVDNLPPSDACYGLPSDEIFTGKIILIRRGECLFEKKVTIAASRGAVAVVMYDNVESHEALVPSVPGGTSIPVIGIRQADGINILQAILNTPPLAYWSEAQVTVENPNGGQLSAFSSLGPASNLALKPYF